MNTPELLSSLTPRSPLHDPDIISDLTPWEDIAMALRGIDREKVSFMLYIYSDNQQCRHNFFAGLFMEAMQNPEIQRWRKDQQPGQVEAMCKIAVADWKSSLIDRQRAELMGVSRPTWSRKYKSLYQIIYKIPESWQTEVMKIVTDRLR